MLRMVEDIVASVGTRHIAPVPELPAPPYTPGDRVEKDQHGKECPKRLAMAVESMSDHSTNEGWEIMRGLRKAGWALAGHDLITESIAGQEWLMKRPNLTNIHEALDFTKADTILVQDKREWDVQPGNFRDPKARFSGYAGLQSVKDVFKLTILKDAHGANIYHAQSAFEMGVHAWVTYYHPKIVKALADFVRERHLIRTYHTVDTDVVPTFNMANRTDGCLLSGAISSVYPIRKMVSTNLYRMPTVTWLKHPGYHRQGSNTPDFLKRLSIFKVAICTSSIYGYSLRKIIEASACGCRVITDLPLDDILPMIDHNLIRVEPTVNVHELNNVIMNAIASYNPDVQREVSELTCRYYDYRVECRRLDMEIENLRRTYQC